MPELKYNRSKWETLSTVTANDIKDMDLAVLALSINHLAIQLLAMTEPALLQSVWKSGIPFEAGGKIDWKAFSEALCRRVE